MSISNKTQVPVLNGPDFTKSKYVYIVQIFVVVLVILVSAVNITLYKSEDKLWYVLLSSCLGYILPEPKYKIRKYDGNE